MSLIRDIKSWPPGTFMIYDNRKAIIALGSRGHGIEPHVGLGMVVANDGKNYIRVPWDSGCNAPYLEYDVEGLNPDVIRHAG